MDKPNAVDTMEPKASSMDIKDDPSSIETGTIVIHSIAERNDTMPRRVGKQPVLKRNFGFTSILGFSCTVMITWEGELMAFLTISTNGGSAGSIYAFIITWIGTICVFATMGELASMAPTSGGWLTVIGWQSGVAGVGYLSGTLIRGIITLNNPSRLLPKVESLVRILHIAGFFAILIPLVIKGSHGSVSDVFTVFQNWGGWQTHGLSFMIGIIPSVWNFLGRDRCTSLMVGGFSIITRWKSYLLPNPYVDSIHVMRQQLLGAKTVRTSIPLVESLLAMYLSIQVVLPNQICPPVTLQLSRAVTFERVVLLPTTRVSYLLLSASAFNRMSSYPTRIITMTISLQDLSFIPAYISAFLSAQYALAKNPAIVNRVLTSITSLFRHCKNSRTLPPLEIWRIPDVAMIPIYLVLAASISCIVRQLELDLIYSSFMLIAVSGTVGLGWIFDLPADLVVFGLSPLFLVTALLVTRLAQNIGGSENIQEEEQTHLMEKA